ncbi:MAG: flagellar basal body rod protein FlgB [Deltaproteobacteria bacterium]|jgi:flagellar basal-body rod protein FlgB|nr:flagellar basal body rod protein FlgB [Deltaproteobacteria bacterium]
MKGIIEGHVNLVGSVMDMQLKRQNVVMSNLANVRTPGYKPRTLEFEKELQAALGLDAKGKLSRTNEKHLPAAFDPASFGPEWDKKFVPRVVHGEDRVDLDKEMAVMAKNSLQYNALASVMKSSFDGIRNVITEGQK